MAPGAGRLMHWTLHLDFLDVGTLQDAPASNAHPPDGSCRVDEKVCARDERKGQGREKKEARNCGGLLLKQLDGLVLLRVPTVSNRLRVIILLPSSILGGFEQRSQGTRGVGIMLDSGHVHVGLDHRERPWRWSQSQTLSLLSPSLCMGSLMPLCAGAWFILIGALLPHPIHCQDTSN
ncbi:hypothetical protein VFPPC_17730 [Pochonia chlamydosporia 170]|uniref:Uncharacterized protein n=1 Tax=Pochonia chlamydosporia 170 TaxID=1380566 RepID=A0A219AS30_METCM|nr:hypothetical protein VFPPC_17730 [Pochonia chlamydosporia 170]OWT43094.1 hypothetical protein VFPPC_17730 [Pochonia chlamydosporia 170]